MSHMSKKIPVRVQICSEIKSVLNKNWSRNENRGITVEKIIADFMVTKGTPRRFTLECINAVVHSGFAKFSFNNKKEKIVKKK